AADEKLKKATVEWEHERAQLKSQIDRLEGAVAEAIARASNPLRSTQPVKEQFEVELNRVHKEKTEIEQAFLRAKTEWEQEKLKMTAEMVKLRRAAQIMGRPVDTPEVNPKIRDLENELKATSKAYQSERLQLNGEIERLEERIHYVPGSQDGVSKGVVDQLRKQYEQRLQETIQQKTQLAEQLQSTSSLLEAERARSSAREATHSGLDEKDIAAEVSRVESLIKEIVALIDNPETELSTIIRKNVQKAELDAYLKGILFVLN